MSDPIDFGQWARQWEAMMRDLAAKMPGMGGAPAFGAPAFGAPNFGASTLGATPWDARHVSGAQSEAIERMLAAGQGYLGMLQSLASSAGGGGQGFGAGLPPWLSGFGNSAGFAPASAPWLANPLGQAMRGFGNNGAAGFEQLMERFAAVAQPILANAKGAFDLPAFGFLREHQEEAQATAKAFVEYQEQMARYNRLMLKVSEGGFARFQLKLAEREEPGRQIDSVRGLYDLWIDALEEAYAEIALSEEFREIYGNLVNAQMRVREHVLRQVERISGEIGVPTRSEVDTIGERLQALRREVRAEREAGGDIVALTREVADLRDEVASLRAAAGTPPARSNVVSFERAPRPAEPAAVSASASTKPGAASKAAAKAARRAPRKAKSMPQVARSASRSTRAEPKSTSKPAHAVRKKVAKTTRASVAPAAKVHADKPSFAARMARFARASTESTDPGVNPKSKPAKR